MKKFELLLTFVVGITAISFFSIDRAVYARSIERIEQRNATKWFSPKEEIPLHLKWGKIQATAGIWITTGLTGLFLVGSALMPSRKRSLD